MKRLPAIFLLLVTTLFWGITFTVVKRAVEEVDVFVFLSQRFLAAFFILLPVSLFRISHLSIKVLRDGIILGLFLFASYAFQTTALRYTTASNAGFLTGLNVIFVPLFGAFLFRQVINTQVRWAVLLATVGLFLLTTKGIWTFNRGDLLATICAVFIAFHLILTGEFTRTSDTCWLTTIQLGVVALLSFLPAQWGGHPVLIWHPEIVWALVICVLFATIFAFLVQTSAQRLLSPAHTALLFCMEPVFAALYAYWAVGEKLGFYGISGAGFILTGMILSELPVSRGPLQSGLPDR